MRWMRSGSSDTGEEQELVGLVMRRGGLTWRTVNGTCLGLGDLRNQSC